MQRAGTFTTDPLPDGGSGAGPVHDSDRRPEGSPTVRPPRAAAIGVVLLLVAFVVAGLSELRRTWYPGADLALAELYVRQIPHHLVTTGPYSAKRDFFHPLPYGFYAVWPSYEIFGRASAALITGTMWFNGVVLAGIAWVLVRRRRVALALLVVVAVGLIVRFDTRDLVLVPWNPYLAALPFLALLVVAPFVARGERWLAPVAVALAGWSAGVHLLFAPSVAAVLVAAIGGLGWTAWRNRRTEPLRRLVAPLAVSVGVAVVVWLPAIVDVARRGRSGNTAGIARFMMQPGAAALTGRDVVAVTLSELAWRPTWTGARVGLGIPPPAMRFPLFLVLGAVAAYIAWRQRNRWELTALGVGLLSIVVSAYALSRASWLVGLWYLLPVRLSAVWFCCVTVHVLGRAAVAWVRRRAGTVGRDRPAAVWTGATLALWVGAVALVAWPGGRPASGTLTSRPDVRAVTARFRPGDPLVTRVTLGRPSAAPVAYLLALDRAGFETHVPADQEWFFGSWRARAAPAGSARLGIGQSADAARNPPGSLLLYRSPPAPQYFGPDLPVSIWLWP